MSTHRRWRGFSWLAMAVVLCGPAGRAVAQPAPGGPRPRDVVMSSAGGISKGSYQAGVDWTISEYLRRQRSPAFRAEVRRLASMAGTDPGELIEFRLRATTGASAGNINALFAAIGWCTARLAGAADIPPESSLFWKTWVNTGTPQLLPTQPITEAAALSREFIADRHKATIRDALVRAEPTDDCDVPVGVTLTKLQPEVVTIGNGQGSIGVQRFAAILGVRRGADPAGVWVDFGWVPDTAERGSYGALALPPRLRNTARETREERLDDVFDIMLASSAFPVAFAPKVLCYEAGGLLPARTDAPLRCEPFSDGGVFDNNPIGLAVRLLETRRERSGAPADPIDVAYSSPGNHRGDLKIARRDVDRPEVRTGLGAAVQLLTGAIASARDYELQSLRRQTERDEERGKADRDERATTAKPWLMLSSRRAPIVGESFYSFGAFLGRPFREYDFYSGIYDGLEFVARHLVCPRPGPKDDATGLDRCTAQVHARFVTDDLMGLTEVGRTVVSWHSDAEYAPPLGTRDGPSARPGAAVATADLDEDGARLVLLRLIHDALAERLTDDRCTSGRGLIPDLLCPGGLEHVLTRLSSKSAPSGGITPGRAADFLRTRCTPDAMALGECTVDQAFRALMRRPKREVYALVRRAIRNVERGERSARGSGAHALAFPSKVAYSLFRSTTMRYRDGTIGPFELNRSSSALGADNFRAALATGVGVLAPNYLHNIVINNRPDQSAFGWQPVSWILSDKAYLNSQLELFLTDLDSDTLFSTRVSDHVGWGASIGTFALPRLRIVGRPTSIDAGVFRLPKSFPADFRSERRYAFRLSTRLIADKIMVTFLANSKMRSVSFGISDLNGIAYWILR